MKPHMVDIHDKNGYFHEGDSRKPGSRETFAQESPTILAHGAWAPGRNGILHWHPTPGAPIRVAVALPTCPTCGAAFGERCTTKAGATTNTHATRIGRACPCGQALTGRARRCDDCKTEVKRAHWRRSQQRKQERKRARPA